MLTEKLKERKRNWYLKNKEKHLERAKNWYLKNKERKNKKQKEWYLKNKENRNIKIKERRKKDPNFKLMENIRRRFRHFLKGNIKSKSTMELLSITKVEFFWNYIESKFKPGMTKENYGKVWHIDHIIPCSSFDPSNHKDQKKCWHYTNLQPLFVHENLSKGSKIIGTNLEILK
jgi:hypothetical protein